MANNALYHADPKRIFKTTDSIKMGLFNLSALNDSNYLC